MEIFSDTISNLRETLGAIGKVFYHIWWIVLPVAFFPVFKMLWMDYVVGFSKDSWIAQWDWIMLEIIPPLEIEKSPQIMEPIFWGMAGILTTPSKLNYYIKGAITDRFGIELVGEEGDIHFYFRVLKKYRNIIETTIYAQYPDAEIVEVSDYTQKFPRTIPNKNWELWGTDFEFTLEDAYPIKTYEEFEEDVTGRLVDPMAAITENLNDLGPGEHIWYQFVISPLLETERNDEQRTIQELAGRLSGKKKGIIDHFIDVLRSIFPGMLHTIEFPGEEKKEEQPLEFRLTPVEKEILKSVEKNLGKNSFLTKIRFIYIGRKDAFNKSRVSSFIGSIKQFNELYLNQLKPEDKSKTYANYIFKKQRVDLKKRKIYTRYKDRDMTGATMTFSTTEMATLFHFPDMEVKTPAVSRVESKRGSAPANLPIK